MIPRPDECNWNNTRPWSDLEHLVSKQLDAALRRCDRLGLAPPPPLNPPSNASLMLMGTA